MLRKDCWAEAVLERREPDGSMQSPRKGWQEYYWPPRQLWVEPCQELIHGQRRKEHVDTDDCGAVLLDSLNVFLFLLFLEVRRISPSDTFGSDIFETEYPSAKETRFSRLKVVHRSTYLICAAFPVPNQLHSDVEVRQRRIKFIWRT